MQMLSLHQMKTCHHKLDFWEGCATIYGDCHILDCQSKKARRVVRSAMDAEVYAIVEVFDAAYLIAEDLKMTHETGLNLFMYTDSLQLFVALTRGSAISERRLMIDILAPRQSYKRFEITGASHISDADNPANGLTNSKHYKVLDEVFRSAKMKRQDKKWIDRGTLSKY